MEWKVKYGKRILKNQTIPGKIYLEESFEVEDYWYLRVTDFDTGSTILERSDPRVATAVKFAENYSDLYRMVVRNEFTRTDLLSLTRVMESIKTYLRNVKEASLYQIVSERLNEMTL